MSTSQKHRNFVSEPMGKKPVTELAGIGKARGGKLNEKKIDHAYQVLGKYLILDKNEARFKAWLYGKCKANRKEQDDCFKCLKDWSDSFL